MPLQLTQIEALAKTRGDIEVRVGETGTKSARDMIVVDPTGKAKGVLTLIDGRLQARNPDERTIQWMLDLAQDLNARVVDNTRRTYRTPTEKYIHPDDVGARKAHLRRIESARSRWLPTSPTIMKWLIIGFFLFAGMIVLLALNG
jgi:t-SNARE complex subunit (syntaxin)